VEEEELVLVPVEEVLVLVPVEEVVLVAGSETEAESNATSQPRPPTCSSCS